MIFRPSNRGIYISREGKVLIQRMIFVCDHLRTQISILTGSEPYHREQREWSTQFTGSSSLARRYFLFFFFGFWHIFEICQILVAISIFAPSSSIAPFLLEILKRIESMINLKRDRWQSLGADSTMVLWRILKNISDHFGQPFGLSEGLTHGRYHAPTCGAPCTHGSSLSCTSCEPPAATRKSHAKVDLKQLPPLSSTPTIYSSQHRHAPVRNRVPSSGHHPPLSFSRAVQISCLRLKRIRAHLHREAHCHVFQSLDTKAPALSKLNKRLCHLDWTLQYFPAHLDHQSILFSSYVLRPGSDPCQLVEILFCFLCELMAVLDRVEWLICRVFSSPKHLMVTDSHPDTAEKGLVGVYASERMDRKWFRSQTVELAQRLKTVKVQAMEVRMRVLSL